MSALWALTGSIDPRPAQDAKVGDVVHDNSKVSRITKCVRLAIIAVHLTIACSPNAAHP